MNTGERSRVCKRSWGSILGLTCMLLIAQGCAQYHLDMKDSDPEEESYQGEMIHALGWGLLYTPQQITTDCNVETGINDVRVKSNYLYNLVGVLTFGIWMPIEIEHRCQAGPSIGIHLSGE